jgi:hypothetical protein
MPTNNFTPQAARELGVAIGNIARQTSERFSLSDQDMAIGLLSSAIGLAQATGMRREAFIRAVRAIWPEVAGRPGP